MMSCWGITSGQAGMVAQVKALATALKLEKKMKKITIRPPFSLLPNAVYASPLRHLIVPWLMAPESDSLAPPYPELVISCGRRGALVAMGLKARASETRFIHIQDPQVNARYFDIVVAMQHDKITGPNVIKIRLALHSITPELLQQEGQKFAPAFAGYAAPRITVLLGGSTNKYVLTPAAMQQVIVALQALQGSLLITPSRRTGEENIRMLRKAFAGHSNAYIYDFLTGNPYYGMLALADFIVVTNDSVNMMSEACATGKPVYILALAGHQNTKPARFAEQLIHDGTARRLSNALDSWSYPVSDEMEKTGQEIRNRLGC